VVGRCIKLKTGVKDRFTCKVAGGCGQTGSSRVKPGEYGRTGRGAERAGGVRPIKKHSPLGQSFKIRGFIKSRVPIESRVRPAKVVGHDKNDIGLG
jgi:hypothetical protein